MTRHTSQDPRRPAVARRRSRAVCTHGSSARHTERATGPNRSRTLGSHHDHGGHHEHPTAPIARSRARSGHTPPAAPARPRGRGRPHDGARRDDDERRPCLRGRLERQGRAARHHRTARRPRPLRRRCRRYRRQGHHLGSHRGPRRLPRDPHPCRRRDRGCNGTTSPPFTNVGVHWSAGAETHGHHDGDLPPVLVQADGNGTARSVSGRFEPSQLVGRAVILHAGPDNLANVPTRYVSGTPQVAGPDAATNGTGDAGGRLACGVIEHG